MEETLQLRVHGDTSLPTLIYLPGLHGDWTLVGAFRNALAGKVRFVEMIYPRTLTWSLEDYAAAIETALADNGVTRGWLLGESFGSQLLWAIIARKQFPAQGVILAGGFARHPLRGAVRLAERLCGRLSMRMITSLIFGYGKISGLAYRRSPETIANLKEFMERRTEADLKAAQHRLHLIAGSDPCDAAKNTTLPVFALTGLLDPIVPWPWVRRWFRKNCANLRDYKIIRCADHAVLVTAPQPAAKAILGWML